MQFPLTEDQRKPYSEIKIDPTVTNQCSIAPLPREYTMVHPVTNTMNPVVPIKNGNFEVNSVVTTADLMKEKQRLVHVQDLIRKDNLEYLSW